MRGVMAHQDLERIGRSGCVRSGNALHLKRLRDRSGGVPYAELQGGGGGAGAGGRGAGGAAPEMRKTQT